MVGHGGTLLALDLGTKCGWAFGFGSAITSGVWDLSPRRFDGGGMRFVRFRGRLDELHGICGIDRAYFEEVRRHKGTDAAHIYGGLMGTFTAWCEDHGIPYEGVPVGAIKKHATGKGNANKEAMIEAMRAKGYDPRDDNEADALALYEFKREVGD